MRSGPFHGMVVVALAALTLAAGPKAEAENLLPNPSFDDGSDFTGWDVNGTGTWALGADSAGCDLSSAADGQSEPAGGGNPFLSMWGFDCLPVDPVTLPELWLGGWYKTSANVYFRLHAAFYSDPSCSSFLEYSPAVGALPTGDWNGLLGSVTVPATAASFRMIVDFNPQVAGLPPFTGSVDQLYAGPEPPLFANGFEAEFGSVCGWNLSQP